MLRCEFAEGRIDTYNSEEAMHRWPEGTPGPIADCNDEIKLVRCALVGDNGTDYFAVSSL